jgi:hypothetical protein
MHQTKMVQFLHSLASKMLILKITEKNHCDKSRATLLYKMILFNLSKTTIKKNIKK